MAKPFAQVTTMQDVYEYARDSYLAASKTGCKVLAGPNKGLSCYCPNTAPQYLTLANKIKTAIAAGSSGTSLVETYKSAILSINAGCRQEIGYKLPPTSTAKEWGPAPPPILEAGFPWWIVLLIGGGALAYYLYTKKGGKAPSPKVRRKRRRGRRKKR
jgi:hypothetical protein